MALIEEPPAPQPPELVAEDDSSSEPENVQGSLALVDALQTELVNDKQQELLAVAAVNDVSTGTAGY